MSDHQELGAAAIKMGIGAGGAVIAGLTLNEWVAIATFVYLAAQLILLVPKYIAWIAAIWRRRG